MEFELNPEEDIKFKYVKVIFSMGKKYMTYGRNIQRKHYSLAV